jgi:methylglyoxal synthase
VSALIMALRCSSHVRPNQRMAPAACQHRSNSWSTAGQLRDSRTQLQPAGQQLVNCGTAAHSSNQLVNSWSTAGQQLVNSWSTAGQQLTGPCCGSQQLAKQQAAATASQLLGHSWPTAHPLLANPQLPDITGLCRAQSPSWTYRIPFNVTTASCSYSCKWYCRMPHHIPLPRDPALYN